MDKSIDEIPRPRPLGTPNTTDDESLTTSTASDSWTLVTDKKNPKTPVTTSIYEEESHLEDLPKYEDLNLEASQTTVVKEEQEVEPSPEHHADTTSVTDEFSDEVSIISESENGDVLTPHPYLREHLQKLNLKFTTGEGLDFATLLQQQQQEEHRLQQKQTTPPNTPIELQQRPSNQTRQRKRRSPSTDETQKTLITQSAASAVAANSQAPHNLIKRVYTLFFYLIVGLTLLGLYSKLFLTQRPLFSPNAETNINTLEKKMIDMELQNNLMRAEIDLLSKQVNYLKTTKPSHNGERNDQKYQSSKENKQYLRDERNINREPTWSTQGSTQIHEYVENAPELPNIEINNQLPNNIESTVESTAQPINELPEELPITSESKQAPTKKYYDDDNHVLKERFRKHNSKKTRDFVANNEEKYKKRVESDEKVKRQNRKYNSKERFHDDDHDYDDDSKERKHSKRDSKERYNDRNMSKERKYNREDHEKKRYNKHNSKEDKRSNEDFKKYDSKENQHQKREHYDNDKQSGEWHGKLMQQRQKSRNEQEKRMKREKNWYLNRNDAREQSRTDEMNHR